MENPNVTIGSQLYHIKFVFAADYKVHIQITVELVHLYMYVYMHVFLHVDFCAYAYTCTCTSTCTLGNMLTNNLHLQFLLLLMGMNKASSTYACLWCTASSEERLPYLVND